MRTFTGGRRLALRSALTIAVATAALSLAPAASQAAFTIQPCHGSATAGRGATFPALLHNSGFWGSGFDSSAGCGNVLNAPAHPTYNPSTVDVTGASSSGSGGGVGACGGNAGGWPSGHRDSNVRFCATDDPMTPAQLQAADGGCDVSQSPVVCTPGVLHQLPWASGAVTVVIHLPEGCSLPAPGADATGPTTGWTGDPSGDSNAASQRTTRPYISDSALEKALAGDPSEQFWGQLVPSMTGTPVVAASGDKQDTKAGLTCNGTTAGDGIPIIRIVRSDNSGTTFNFKSFLGQVAGGLGGDPNNNGSWTGNTSNSGGTPLNSTAHANTAWPEVDSFGTPFNAGAAGHQADTNNICEWSNDATTGFPSPNPDVAANHICGGQNTGGGRVALGVEATDGSIGYVDIATARNTKEPGVPAAQQDFQDVQTSSGTRDDTFWIPVQNCPDASCTQTYKEPTQDATNHLVSGSGEVGTRNAACKNLPNLTNVPTAAASPSGDATLGDWSNTIAVGGSGYPICVLTYGLVWDDNAAVYGNNAAEQGKARTVLDYVTFIASAFGQSFVGTDFSSPPANIQAIMRTGTEDGTGHGGVAAIDFNKTACVSNCGGTTTTPPTTTTTTPSGGTTPPPISNKFTISAPHTKGQNLLLTLKLPGGGKIRVTATFTFKRHKVTFASLTSSVHGGNGTVTLKPTSTAVKDFRNMLSSQKIKVTVSVTFTPTGGTAKTSTVTLTIRGFKTPPKHHKK